MDVITHDDELLEAFRGDPAPRSGKPWTEEDFAAVMQACRAGATIEQIARRIGRTPGSLPMQLRRLLPLEERHLPAELALPRLRQLDADGDYDWLTALAQREQTAWERQLEAQQEKDARGIGALEDDELLTIASALAIAPVAAPHSLQRSCAQELMRRGLGGELERSTATAREALIHRLFGPSNESWGVESWPSGEPWSGGDSDVGAGWSGLSR